MDFLMEWSHALTGRVAAAAPWLGEPGGQNRRRSQRSGFVWAPGVIVTSEQGLPDGPARAVLPGGEWVEAAPTGRDASTNIALFRLPTPVPAGPAAGWPAAGDPAVGALALLLGGDGDGGPAARFGLVSSVGGAWTSMAGGRIDRLIRLDARLSPQIEGGPVLDAAGGLLGMSTLGPRRRALVIPATTIARVVAALLSAGRVPRGWLGVSLHPVCRAASARGRGGGRADDHVAGPRRAGGAGRVAAGRHHPHIRWWRDRAPTGNRGRLGGSAGRAHGAAPAASRRRCANGGCDDRGAPLMLELLTRAEAAGESGNFVHLRVAVQARDPVRVAALAALVAATGHEVAAEDEADLLLSDAPAATALPLLVLSDDGQDSGISALPAAAAVPVLNAAMRAVAAGLIVRAPAADGFGPARPLLTPRELEILGCLGEGLSNKAVARRLGISQHTVKFHLEAVFTKLGANSRAEAVAKGLRGGLLEI